MMYLTLINCCGDTNINIICPC